MADKIRNKAGRLSGGEKMREPEPASEPAITARIFSLKDGLKTYENVAMIRIVSRDYTLLVMKDYMPLIGKLEGSIQIAGQTEFEDLTDILGYYVFHKNQFELLIDEETYVQ